MFVWDQSAGQLLKDGKLIATGYSGKDFAMNNPHCQGMVGMGPIPRGDWHIDGMRDSPRTGPATIILSPIGDTDTEGRSEFRIHGDNQLGNHSASHGCIILPRYIRVMIMNSGDRQLRVVE